MKMIRLGILKTDDVHPMIVDEYGEYPDMFATLLSAVDSALAFVTYEVHKGEYPSDLNEVDAYLITGSKFSVYEQIGWITELQEFVRRLHQARKKLIGICFGHQLIAQSLGGKTEKTDRGWGIGSHSVVLTDKAGDLDVAGSGFRLLVSHQDQVVEPADGAEVLAGSEFCPNAMCRIDSHILTFQGHPEFTPGYALKLMNLRRDKYDDDLYQQAVDSLILPLDKRRVAQWIVDFIRH